MKIRNAVTYTTQGNEARYENQTVLDRSRSLTTAGAQRILRRDHPSAIVSRVETMTYA